MIVKVAGEKKEYPEGLTVKELIEKENVETPQYVTVTINDEFVESGAFETTERSEEHTSELQSPC